jgi:hypothetical protein
MAQKFDETTLENEVYDSVTLTPLTTKEMLALLDRVKARVEALPVVAIRDIDGWTAEVYIVGKPEKMEE